MESLRPGRSWGERDSRRWEARDPRRLEVREDREDVVLLLFIEADRRTPCERRWARQYKRVNL